MSWNQQTTLSLHFSISVAMSSTSENVDAQQSNASSRTGVNESSLLYLPIVLLCEILSFLPSEAIFSCTCVCKTFHRIIRDPGFAEFHLSKAPYRDSSLLLQERLSASRVFISPIHDLDKYEPENFYISFWHTLTAMPAHISNARHCVSIIVGACNGLLCVRHLVNRVSYLYVCNPLLGEYMLLPKLRQIADSVVGFGFCPKTKKYKILRCPSSEPCEIYTLGTENWRTIGNVPSPILSSFNPSFNGCLHWMTSRKWICAFSLETEQCSYIPSPAHFENDYTSTNIGTFDGLFCVWHKIHKDIFEVYVMTDYGVAESWTNVIRIDLSSIFGPSLKIPTRFLDNGVLVFSYSDSPLVYYNIRDETAKSMISESSYDAVYFAPSIISLKRIAPEWMVEVVQRNRLAIPFLPCS